MKGIWLIKTCNNDSQGSVLEQVGEKEIKGHWGNWLPRVYFENGH